MSGRHVLAATALPLGLAACISSPPPPVEFFRSAPQTLVLENRGLGPLLVEPQEGAAIPPLTVPPAGTGEITFAVVTLADLQPAADRPWQVRVPGSETNLLADAMPVGYLRQADLALELRVRAPKEEVGRRVRLSLQCAAPGWEAGPAPAARCPVDLDAPPPRLCPATCERLLQ